MLAIMVLAAQVATIQVEQEELKTQLVSLNWYLHFECEGCTYLVLHYGAVKVLAPAKQRVFHWVYYWKYPSVLQVGEVIAEMAATVYKITLEPSGQDAWITPIGLAFKEPPPYPKWHGQDVAPDEWVTEFTKWYESHDVYVDEDVFAKQMEQLRVRRKGVVELKLQVKISGGRSEKSVGEGAYSSGTQFRPNMLVPQSQPGTKGVRSGGYEAEGRGRVSQSP